tara:strand:+ start:505 stop:729 length:225 start_codon:yes stop_codon:yes gene_type:complete
MIRLEDREDWERELEEDSDIFWALYEEQSQTITGDILSTIIEMYGRPDQVERAKKIYQEGEKRAKELQYYHKLD